MLISTTIPKITLHLRRSKLINSWARLATLLGLISLCFVMFFTIEVQIRAGQSAIHFGADTSTYYDLANEMQVGRGGNLALLSFSGNLLGPIVMAILVKSPFLIMISNIAIFFVALQLCASTREVSRTKLGLLLAVNPMTLVSMATLNKEIFALVSSLLLCRYIYNESRSRFLLGATLILGLAARWEQPAITLLFLFFRREKSFFRRHPIAALSILIASITVAYPLALRSPLIDLTWATSQAQQGGAIIILNNLQASFGFPLVVIPKALLSLYNRWTNPWYFLSDYWQQDFTDYANQYIIHLNCLAMLIVSVVALFRKRLSLDKPLPFLMAIYIIITSANTFIQPRYQYPVYVLLCFELARRQPLLARLPSGFTPSVMIEPVGGKSFSEDAHNISAEGTRSSACM